VRLVDWGGLGGAEVLDAALGFVVALVGFFLAAAFFFVVVPAFFFVVVGAGADAGFRWPLPPNGKLSYIVTVVRRKSSIES
tara:strand:+ start:1314 stop:1556 length:243 start_codon:yes stop_codon:yes gene_type:complete